MVREHYGRDTRYYIQQPDVTLNQANPVSGTQYAVLSSTFVRLITAVTTVTWTVQPSPLELHIDIDGNALIYLIANPASGSNYTQLRRADGTENIQILNVVNRALDVYQAFFLEGKIVEIAAEVTGGTSNPLESRIKWARYM